MLLLVPVRWIIKPQDRRLVRLQRPLHKTASRCPLNAAVLGSACCSVSQSELGSETAVWINFLGSFLFANGCTKGPLSWTLNFVLWFHVILLECTNLYLILQHIVLTRLNTLDMTVTAAVIQQPKIFFHALTLNSGLASIRAGWYSYN